MLTTAVLLAGLAIGQLPAEKPPQATPPPATPAPAQTAPKAPTVRPSITVLVTDRQGKPLPEIAVKATGTMEREGKTDSDGTIILRNLNAGTYRLRFESADDDHLRARDHRGRRPAGQDDRRAVSGSAPAAATEAGAGTAAGRAASAARPTVGTAQLRVDSGLRREELHQPRGAVEELAGRLHRRRRRLRWSSCENRSPNTPMPKPTKCSTSSPARVCSGSAAST